MADDPSGKEISTFNFKAASADQLETSISELNISSNDLATIYTNDNKFIDEKVDIQEIRAPGDMITEEYVETQSQIYNILFLDYPVSIGKALSKKEREYKNQSQISLIYGEISFDSFGIIFMKIKKEMLTRPLKIFYDLGSGTGKPVFAAALLCDFDKVVGIEILEGLHKASLSIYEKWEDEIKKLLPSEKQKTTISFHHGDALDSQCCNWSDADIVFANSTCFDDSFMKKLADRAIGLQSGTFFITLTKKLPSEQFKVVETMVLSMSWGSATIFIQIKIDNS